VAQFARKGHSTGVSIGNKKWSFVRCSNNNFQANLNENFDWNGGGNMIKGRLDSNLVASLNTETHSFISGLSIKIGGGDEAPDPHELVEAGLAGCTILTCQLYANRKGWPLKSTNVSVHIESEGKEATKIIREISFEGELTDEQRTRLFEIANKCPIHILLHSKITIESKHI
jgi:putative redox protein